MLDSTPSPPQSDILKKGNQIPGSGSQLHPSKCICFARAITRRNRAIYPQNAAQRPVVTATLDACCSPNSHPKPVAMHCVPNGFICWDRRQSGRLSQLLVHSSRDYNSREPGSPGHTRLPSHVHQQGARPELTTDRGHWWQPNHSATRPVSHPCPLQLWTLQP